MSSFNQWLEHDGVSIGLILVGAAILYYGGSVLVAFLTKKLVKQKNRRIPKKDAEKRQKTLSGLTVAIWRTAVGVIAVISIMKVFFPALDLSPLFASAGIVGVAVAFGSQTLVKDLLTGIFIVSENQYRIGDVVEINGAEGRVEHLGTRSTVLRDTDGNVHYLPNGSIIHVVNKTMGFSRVNFTLSLSATANLDNAISIINQVGDDLARDPEWKKRIIEAPQFKAIDTISAATVSVSIVGKVQPADQWSVTAEMRRRLLDEFAKGDISLA